jgi:hypothetical protein
MAEIWGAAIIGGGALLGGVLQGQAAKSAASTQAGAAENAAAVQQNMFNTMYQGQTPYMQAGYGALNNLDYLLGISPQTSTGGAIGGGNTGGYGGGYTAGPNGSIRPMISGGPQMNGRGDIGGMGQGAPNPATAQAPPSGASQAGGWGSLLTPFSASMMQQYSPAYQYQLQQGEQGVLNGMSSGQGSLSGAAQLGLQQNNQALANTAFNNAFNQYQTQQGNIYQRLAGIAQQGQGAASNAATGASTFAGGIGQSYQNVGTALAGGQVGQANAYAGALNNAAPWLYQGMGGGGPGQTPWLSPNEGVTQAINAQIPD